MRSRLTSHHSYFLKSSKCIFSCVSVVAEHSVLQCMWHLFWTCFGGCRLFFYTNEHSVLQCMWHLLRTFLQHISIQYCPVASDNHSLPQSLWSRIRSSNGIRMALLACCMFSMSSSSEFISCTWAVLTSSNAFEKTSGMAKPWTLCATMYVASPLNLLAYPQAW